MLILTTLCSGEYRLDCQAAATNIAHARQLLGRSRSAALTRKRARLIGALCRRLSRPPRQHGNRECHDARTRKKNIDSLAFSAAYYYRSPVVFCFKCWGHANFLRDRLISARKMLRARASCRLRLKAVNDATRMAS